MLIAAILSVIAIVTGLGNDMYRHDRRAIRTFSEWQERPTAETEHAWQEARDAAMARDMKFKGICFGVAALFALAAWRCHRVAQALASADGSTTSSTPVRSG
jgi:hypothetical protein